MLKIMLEVIICHVIATTFSQTVLSPFPASYGEPSVFAMWRHPTNSSIGPQVKSDIAVLKHSHNP